MRKVICVRCRQGCCLTLAYQDVVIVCKSCAASRCSDTNAELLMKLPSYLKHTTHQHDKLITHHGKFVTNHDK